MGFIDGPIEGIKIFEPSVFGDERGYFFESYNQKNFEEAGIRNHFVQDNESLSSFGIIRGLHYQLNPSAQAKLVRVGQGEVLDVVVDIREGSKSYGQHFSIILSAENKKQLFIPRGFAHGFSTLSKEAVFIYKCDNYYSREDEGGIAYDDPAFKIDWMIPEDQIILSAKDQTNPAFGNHKKFQP